MEVTQEDLQTMLETEAGRSAVIHLVLAFQNKLDNTLSEMEANAKWARDDMRQTIEWSKSQKDL